MNIRRAHPTESEELSRLAIASKASWGYSAEQLAIWSPELRISPESIANEPTFVAEEQGRLLGVAQLDTKVMPWALECLWVHPSATGRGVGGQLVRHTLDYARTRGSSELRVDADPHAEGFYLRLGARRVGAVAAPIAGEPSRVRPQLSWSRDEAQSGTLP